MKTLSTIVLVLMLTFPAMMTAFNGINAQQFYSYMTVSPNPVGIGQTVLIEFGFTMPTPLGQAYSGWTVTVTDPSGQNRTLGPYTSDTTGGTWATFAPTSVGTWYFQAWYPGANVSFPAKPPVPAATYYVPAQYTPRFALTVQQQPLPSYQSTPLPDGFWKWPIYSDNREWSNIGANWLMSGYDTVRTRTGAVSGVFNPYSQAPNSAHIVWTKPWMFGGVVGGTLGQNTYYTGSNYREEVTPPLVINGRIFYNQVDPPAYGFYCVDLTTGETIWFQNQTFLSGTGSAVGGTAAQLTCGQILLYNTMNQNGGMPYLWSISGTTWARYDAFSGNLLNTIVNATTGSVAQVFGKNGELLVYYFNLATKSLLLWNSSLAVTGEYNQAPRFNVPWRDGIQWNVTVPVSSGEGTAIGSTTWDPKNPTMLIITNQTQGSPGAAGPFTDIAYSMVDGHVLWSQTRNTGGDTWEQVLFASRQMGDGIYTIFRKETRQLYGFDANTGNQLWVSDPMPSFWSTFLSGTMFAYGKIYAATYDGTVYAFDEHTGKIAWEWSCNSVNPSNLETPYGGYPFYGAIVAADGKLFVHNQEHTENSPMYRGMAMYALDANTGKFLWSMNGKFKELTIAGGYLVSPNMCDGLIYCFGKGQTTTTVSAPQTSAVKGHAVTIAGSLTDQSPGAKGTPCVSEDSMSAWMAYVYEQQPKPTNATGVKVSLTAIDPNGNSQNIGEATTDLNGNFGIMWTPPVEGLYQIMATFKGTNSYFGSQATTYLGVEPAPSPAPTATPTPPTPTAPPTAPPTTAPPTTPTLPSPSQPEAPGQGAGTEMYIIAAVAVAVIVAAAVAAVILRRRK